MTGPPIYWTHPQPIPDASPRRPILPIPIRVIRVIRS